MLKSAKFATATRFAAALAAAVSLSACETMEADLKDTYTPQTHYERYPIKVSKQPIKVTVSSKQGHVTPMQAAELAAAGRHAHGLANGGTVSIRRPSAGGNSARVAAEVKSLLQQQGVPASRIVESTYSAGSNSPVVVSFVSTVAVTEECGSWNNLAYQPDNAPFDNFGCAHQHNIAAMVANPQDLVVPQPMTPPDAGKLSKAMDKYRGYAPSMTSSGSSSGSSSSGGGDSGGSSSSSEGGDSGSGGGSITQ
jgi:pilus assembly protein CpaD